MTDRPILEWLRTQPFRPFRLVMSSGQVHEVRQRDMAFLTQEDILVGIDKVGDGIPDDVKICSLAQVDAIESLTDPASSA